MATMTVGKLAEQTKKSVEQVLDEMRKAGLDYSSAEEEIKTEDVKTFIAAKSRAGAVAAPKVEVQTDYTGDDLEERRRKKAEERRSREEESESESEGEKERQPEKKKTKSGVEAPPPMPPKSAAPARKRAADAEHGRRRRAPRSRFDRERADQRLDDIDEIENVRAAPGVLTPKIRPQQTVLKAEGRQQAFRKPAAQRQRVVKLEGETISIKKFALALAVTGEQVLAELRKIDPEAEEDAEIPRDSAVLLAEELGHKGEIVAKPTSEQWLAEEIKHDAPSQPRSAVITVMGHVDHGKTTLLDYLRKSQVAAGEAGGITQSIGAYQVEAKGARMTFIDTPGHAAFSAMRARGAQCTDIVVLVVAADDGVMPQTREAINHAQSAEAPMVVAINKIDLEEKDIERIRNELMSLGVVPEDMQGDTQFVEISAATGAGVDKLLEALSLQAEILDLQAPREAPAQGVVLESHLDKGRGSVVSLLVRSGTLNKGDVVVAGEHYGKLRAMNDENGRMLKQAGPSAPVEVVGLDGLPESGVAFVVLANDKKARELLELREEAAAPPPAATAEEEEPPAIEDVFAEMLGEKQPRQFSIVLKADTRGSMEAIGAALEQLNSDDVKLRLLPGVGGISESDANLAVDGALLIGFNVRADAAARRVVEKAGLDLRYFSVIYELIEDVEQLLAGAVEPEERENIVGVAEVREVFHSPRLGQIAGCMVVDGLVQRNNPIRVLRDNVVIFEGELESLRRFKENVVEVRNGTECGIGVKNYDDVSVGDKIEVFEKRERPAKAG